MADAPEVPVAEEHHTLLPGAGPLGPTCQNAYYRW